MAAAFLADQNIVKCELTDLFNEAKFYVVAMGLLKHRQLACFTHS